MKLRGKRIDGIHQKVYLITAQNITGLFSFQIFFYDHQVKRRIDIFQACGKDITFRASYCRIQGEQLAVLVGYGHIVTVEDDEMAHAGTHNHFSSITTDATDTYDRHRGIAEMVQHFLPHEHACSFLPVVYHIRFFYNPLAFPSSQIASISARVMSVSLRPCRMVCSSR